MKVAIVGRSKVGLALARALREANHEVQLRGLRQGPPRRPFDASLLVLAVRDGEIRRLAEMLAARGVVRRSTPVVHVAGALGPEVLAPLRGASAGVGQAHPLVSFAASSAAPVLRGALLLVAGDAAAVRRACSLARSLGMVPRVWPRVDPAVYHAAAVLVANGAVALASGGARLLVEAGVPRREAERALGPLLRSVAENVERLGLPRALTGPVRRGDAATIERHLALLAGRAPELLRLYLASAEAQLDLARALGDASRAALQEVVRVVRDRRRLLR